MSDPTLEVCFVWNRSRKAFEGSEIPADIILDDLEKCGERKPDLIVEVAHPTITKKVLNSS
jgi:aspartate dehydrogenase